MKRFELFGNIFNVHSEVLEQYKGSTISISDFEDILKTNFGDIHFCHDTFSNFKQEQHDEFVSSLAKLANNNILSYPV